MKLARSYPLPFMALAGLAAGAVETFGFGSPGYAKLIWYGTLIIGGTPVVWKTIVGMFRHRFAADLVAMLAIVTAVLTD